LPLNKKASSFLEASYVVAGTGLEPATSGYEFEKPPEKPHLKAKII